MIPQFQQFQSTLPRGERLRKRKLQADFGDFNPRSREGSDEAVEEKYVLGTKFQSTLPRGERRGAKKVLVSEFGDFNPRSREGSDEFLDAFGKWLCRISIHAPARGATVRIFAVGVTARNFNPRSREGSDVKRLHRSGA